MDTKIFDYKKYLDSVKDMINIYYAIGIGCTILVLFFVSKRSKFISDIFSLPFQMFRAVQSMLFIAQLVLLAFLGIILYKIMILLSSFAPTTSFVAEERVAHNVKEEQVHAAKVETPKKENAALKNTREKKELSEAAQIAAILERLDEYDLSPTRRQKFWYDLKLFFWEHYLDIIVTIALIIAYRIFSDWRAKKHQSNIRYRNRLRKKARQARRKKNFWLDPIGTIVNLPHFSVLSSYIGEDGQIETDMEQWGSQNVMVPNAQNAPNQPQKKMSQILDFAQRHKKTIFFVIATIITTIITILVVRYLLRKTQPAPSLPAIDISEEEEMEEPKQEEEENELRLEESEKGNDEDEEGQEKEEDRAKESEEEMDEEEELGLEPSEDANDDEKTSKLTDEESNEEGGEQTTSVLTDQAEGEDGQKAKKTPIWGILSTLVLMVAIL